MGGEKQSGRENKKKAERVIKARKAEQSMTRSCFLTEISFLVQSKITFKNKLGIVRDKNAKSRGEQRRRYMEA